jgi:hypothetical protein
MGQPSGDLKRVRSEQTVFPGEQLKPVFRSSGDHGVVFAWRCWREAFSDFSEHVLQPVDGKNRWR